MAGFDPSTATLAPGQFDPSTATEAPPPPPRGALAEIGTGLARGAISGLPELGGQALKFVGAQQIGNNLQQFGEQMGQKPGLTMHPEEHGGFVNALAGGAEQIAPMVAAPLAVGAAAAALPFELPAAAVAGAGALAGGALFGAQAGESTLEKAQAKGVNPEAARSAANLNAAGTFATMTGLGLVGGQMLGKVGSSVGKVLGGEGVPLAEQVLGQMSGTQGVLKPFLQQLPVSAAEAVGVGAAQAGIQAGVEQHYGVDDTDPLTAMKDSIVPMLGLTAVMSPLGLAGRALGVRAAKMRTDTLSNADTAPDIRSQLADQYAAALAKVNPDAATAFRANAETAITGKQGLPVDSNLLTPDTIQPVTPEAPPAPTPLLGYSPVSSAPMVVNSDGTAWKQGQEFTFPDGSKTTDLATITDFLKSQPQPQPGEAATPLLGYTPQARLEFNPTPWAVTPEGQAVRPGTLFNFPDGSSSNDIAHANDYITAQPEAQRPAAWAKMLGIDTTPAATPEESAQHTQTLTDLHDQVKSALTDAGMEPAQPPSKAAFGEAQGLKGQDLAKAYKAFLADPATRESLMRQDADSYQQMLAEREAAPEPQLNAKVDEAAPPDRTNTQLADALNDAMRQKQIDDAYTAYDAHREAERSAIANRAQGEQLATAAERGEVQPDANAPKAVIEITNDADAVKQEADGASGPTMRAFDARVGKLGLDGKATHQDQIDTLQAAIDKGGMSTDVRTMMQALADRWNADMPKEAAKEAPAPAEAPAAPVEKPAPTNMTAEPPPQAATLGENIPPSTPDTAEPPAHVAALGENIPKSPREQARGVALSLDRTLVSFNDRLRAGEQLSPLEKERYEDVKELRQTLAQINSPKGGMNNQAYIQQMVDLARKTEQPYTESQRLAQPLKMAAPDAVDPAIMAPAIRSHNLSDLLTHLADNGSQPWVKDLAARLNELGLKTKIFRGDPSTTVAGEYNRATDTVEINPGGESEQTIMHEAVHAGLANVVDRASQIVQPRNQSEAQLKRAYQDFEQVRNDALKKASAADQYGLTDAQEFAAELMSNPDFQQFLKDQGTQKSLWQRAVDAVRRLFGLPVDARAAFEKAMDAANVMFDAAKNDREFNASPEGAAKATDNVLYSFAKTADKLGDKVPFESIGRGVFHNMLGWKTVDFIAHGVRGVPEMVQSGFADAVDAYRAARDARRVAAEHLSSTLGDYVKRTQQALRDTKDARSWGEKMMSIAGEASIGGFDYRKNHAENLKADPTLDAAKEHVDDIHRQYVQLKAAQPKLADALVEGEKQNRKTLVQQVSSIAANLMGARSGVIPRLEAELTRMAPDDANRARIQDQLAAAKNEALFVNTHMRGLDFMGADLKGARNGLPDMHLDGASSALAARLGAMFKAARDLPDGSPLRDHLAELARMYGTQVKTPYFSLGRSGDYFVNIAFKPGMDAQTQAKLQAALAGTNKVLGDLSGQSHAFFRVDSADQALGMYKKLLAAGGDKLDVSKSANGLLGQMNMQNAAGITPALRQLHESLQDMVDSNKSLTPDQAMEMKQTLSRQLLSMLPETNARSAKMQRRGVPGYDADFVGNFAKRASGAVQDLSNAYTNRQFSGAVKSMSDSIEGMNRAGTMDNKVRAQMVADEINQRYANSMKQIDSSHINLINSLGHTFYLAASPAFYIRTMAQPYHRGLPILGSRYGFVTAAKEIGAATGISVKVIANTIRQGWAEGGMRGVLDTGMRFDDLGLSKPDEGFVQEMHDRGILKLGQAQQLQHAITGTSQRSQDVARLASMTAQYAEMTNRLAVGLAAFRMASRDLKMSSQAATEWAVKAINNSMDNFDPDNTARQIGKHGFAGKVTPLLTSFMNYSLQTMQQIVRTVHDGYFGQDTSADGLQRAKEAKKEFAGLMGTTAMISGVMGLPFVNAFAGVYNMLTKDNDDPSDIRGSVRNFLSDTFGQSGGDLISHGIGHLVNMDTSTFGLENLLPGSEFLASRQLLKDRIESQSQQLLGPAINAGIDVALAAGKVMDGLYVKGIEQALPSGIKPYYKAAELAGALGPGGYTDAKGNPMQSMQSGSWDVGLQAVGFRTAAKATRDEAQHELSENQNLLQNRREILTDRVYKAFTANDSGALSDAMADIGAFNAKNPMQPIRDIGSIVRQHAIEQAIGIAGGAGVTGTRRELPIIQQQLRYAAMPQGQ